MEEDWSFALELLGEDQREGFKWLLRNRGTLRKDDGLTLDMLVENVILAYEAREMPWAKGLKQELFFNYVLPYAVIDEKREDWRADLMKIVKGIVDGVTSSTEAVIRINMSIWDILKVRYSTGRRIPNQSIGESKRSGLASCTGLSIILVSACRSVGIPARLVGTPQWSKGSGNHSWVEVWSEGDWHFVGAAEQDPLGLDRGWFSADASRAIEESYLHAIYASSFEKRSLHFPLVWDMGARSVYADNVTSRYVPKSILPKLPPGASGEALAALDSVLKVTHRDGELIKLANLEWAQCPLSREDAAIARRLLWDWYVRMVHRERTEEHFVQKVIKGERGLEMRFWSTSFGSLQKDRPLYISLHGGGGAAPQVNDSQWTNQCKLYQPAEGVYCCPRAPTNTWNLWHENHMDEFLTRLISNMIVFERVDPSRIYLMGYSAGGDGVYKLAPRMADHFAAAAMMAGHNNGEPMLGLRNLPFSIQCGAEDHAYDRANVARANVAELDRLQDLDPCGYQHHSMFPATGHWMNGQDAQVLPWLAQFTRQERPSRVVWKQNSDRPHKQMYWVACDDPAPSSLIVVAQDDASRQHFVVQETSPDVKCISLLLDDTMCDLDKEVLVSHASGTVLSCGTAKRTIASIIRSLHQRGDPLMLFDATISFNV